MYGGRMPQTHLPSRLQTLRMMLLSVAMFGMVTACGSDSGDPNVPVQCPPTVSKTVDSRNPRIHLTYQEPTQQRHGERLETLSHTTIYYDIGGGTIEYSKHSASSPFGGGTVKTTIILPLNPGETVTAQVCVTASNSAGESHPSQWSATSDGK